MGRAKVNWGERWVVGGDFNMVLHVRKRSGLNTRMGEIEEFNEKIDLLGLVDLSLGGGRWTWLSGREYSMWSRIDRFFIFNCLLM